MCRTELGQPASRLRVVRKEPIIEPLPVSCSFRGNMALRGGCGPALQPAGKRKDDYHDQDQTK